VWVLSIAVTQAQETEVSEKIEVLEATRERVISEEKDALKRTVEGINERLEDNSITEEEADRLKNDAAERHALNIENRIAIIDNKIELLKRNEDVEALDDEDRLVVRVSTGDDDDDSFVYVGKSNSRRKYDRRTKCALVFSFGLNNVITEGRSLNDSPYKVWGSKFTEFGLAWSTRVFNESNWLRIKYGFSFQFNGLKPTDNRYFVDKGTETVLEVFPERLDKSKFRVDNVVIPIHFEFGPSRKIEKKNYFRYSTHRSFKLGLGGYGGIKMSSRQKLKYRADEGRIKEKQKGEFNTNNFIYGLSGYIGYSDISLYVKYDLNTIFKDNPIKERNVSLGLRWDWD
jgi:hypothetical protein